MHAHIPIKYKLVYNTIPAITDNSYSHKLPHGDKLSGYTNQDDAALVTTGITNVHSPSITSTAAYFSLQMTCHRETRLEIGTVVVTNLLCIECSENSVFQ